MTKQLSPQQLELIARPLPPAAVKHHPSKSYLSTIKSIFITERLNQVFGVGGWQVKTELINFDGSMPIKVETRSTSKGERTEYASIAKTIFEVPEHGIYYECIAGSSNDDMGDSTKGSTSDGLSKIASWLGIGADVYKGNYSHSEALHNHVSRIDTLTEIEAFSNENRKDLKGAELTKFDQMIKARKLEIAKSGIYTQDKKEDSNG